MGLILVFFLLEKSSSYLLREQGLFNEGAFLNDVGAEILLMEGHERQAN